MRCAEALGVRLRNVRNQYSCFGTPPGYRFFSPFTDPFGAAPFTLTATQISDLESGLWYVNVRSADFPEGELRGQILPADSDGDGVPDDVDECPNTPPGAIVNADGCSINDALSMRRELEKSRRISPLRDARHGSLSARGTHQPRRTARPFARGDALRLREPVAQVLTLIRVAVRFFNGVLQPPPPWRPPPESRNESRSNGAMEQNAGPCYGKNCQARGRFLVLLFFLHIKSCLCLLLRFLLRQQIWLAFSGCAQVSMTWLNLLSVQPLGRTLYRFQDWPEKRTGPIL